MSIQIAPCWLNFATDIAGGLAIMNRLVIWQTLRAFKSLVTLRALVEPLLFIGASAIRPANKVIVPETCDRGENKKLGHAGEIYIAPEIHGIKVGPDCDRTWCGGPGCFWWTRLFHIVDKLFFPRALPCGWSGSGRTRRTFHTCCNGTAWVAPHSNNILQKNSFSTWCLYLWSVERQKKICR